MSSRRLPRRTRVYDANYNIGQSYYKPAIDNLDRKYYGRSTESAPPVTPRNVNFDIDDKFEDDLKAARSRAARAIVEDTVFDSRGMKSRKGAPISSVFDDDIDEEVRHSLNRINAAKKTIVASINDFENEDASTPIRKRANDATRRFLEEDGEEDFKSSLRNRKLRSFDDNEEESKISSRTRRLLELNGDEDTGRSKFRSRKALEMNGDEDVGSKARSRALKGVTRFDDSITANSSSSLTSSIKRVAISDSVETSSSAASMRAKASKARIADIESEMSERSERLLEREKRAANLKKILAESEMEAIAAA